jgi:hypothetical protein
MSFIDDAANTIKNVFLGSVDSWWERLEADLVLKSPKGTEFRPRYRGDDSFKFEKRLGIYEMPLVKGAIIQDMDAGPMRIPLDLWFDGRNNDVDARAFFAACKERGKWEMTHPVHGFYGLQLVSVEMVNSNDGITRVSTDWIEYIDPKELKTARELAGIVDEKMGAVSLGALSEFVAELNAATGALKHVIKTTSQGIENVVDWALYPLFGTVNAVDDAMSAVHVGITDSLNAVAIPLAELGGQLQALVEYPALATRDRKKRLDGYGELAIGLFALMPGGATTPLKRTSNAATQRNNLLVLDLALSSCINALARIATTSDYKTREEALDTASEISALFNDIIARLEEQQAAYNGNFVDAQFFAQKQTYTDLALLMSATIQYILQVSFDLKIKQVITLQRPTLPVMLAAEYYDDFEKVDFLIDTNELKGADIILLPAGREVAIYV